MEKNSLYPNLLQFDIFKEHSRSLFHFTTTIHGGVSKGNYSTFNLGLSSGDNEDDVMENRRRLTSIMNISSDKLLFPYQIHSDKACFIEEFFFSKSPDEKLDFLYGNDAVITDQKGICICVNTADCVPVLLFDPVKSVLAAVHAGWRGTVVKIVSKTISLMKERYGCLPSSIIAGIAPSISQKYFEVGEEVVKAFTEGGFNMEKIGYRNPASGKMHINLQSANRILMKEAGVLSCNIEDSGYCTYSHPDLFFSARRQTINSGRIMTGGMLL